MLGITAEVVKYRIEVAAICRRLGATTGVQPTRSQLQYQLDKLKKATAGGDNKLAMLFNNLSEDHECRWLGMFRNANESAVYVVLLPGEDSFGNRHRMHLLPVAYVDGVKIGSQSFCIADHAPRTNPPASWLLLHPRALAGLDCISVAIFRTPSLRRSLACIHQFGIDGVAKLLKGGQVVRLPLFPLLCLI
jgi:hypothetical protein